MSFLAPGFLPFSTLNKKQGRENGKVSQVEKREGQRKAEGKEPRLSWVTDVIRECFIAD